MLPAFQSSGEQLGTTPAECSKSVRALLKALFLLLVTPVGLCISPPLLEWPQLDWGLNWGLWVNAKMEHCQRAQESFQLQQDQLETCTSSVESISREEGPCITH